MTKFLENPFLNINIGPTNKFSYQLSKLLYQVTFVLGDRGDHLYWGIEGIIFKCKCFDWLLSMSQIVDWFCKEKKSHLFLFIRTIFAKIFILCIHNLTQECHFELTRIYFVIFEMVLCIQSLCHSKIACFQTLQVK